MAQARDQELVDRFETFYRRYYSDQIADLARQYPREDKSLDVDWQDLFRFDPEFADEFLEMPRRFTAAAEEALRLYDLPVDVTLSEAHVRLYDLPAVTEIRDIRSEHLGTLISVQGIVRKATSVKPKIEQAAFECLRCGTVTVVPQADGGFQDPYKCDGCEREGPFQFLTESNETEFIDAQKLRIQESPEGLGGGETPESIDMHIEDDITGQVSPGDHVLATGILQLDDADMESSDSRVFDMYLDGVSVEVEDEEFEEMEISDADKEEIIRLSEQSDVYERIIDSIAPTIYGYDVAKLAIALQLFSGVTKHLPDGARIRGDIHILLVGDPGTGKSQILQYIRNIAPRSVYTSGKGSSSAGLTAAAVRDDFGDGQQWSLEAGALVLADKGVAAIDELDKMAPDDRSAMHEALEQQSYHPNSEILLADGRRVAIGEFVDERMADRTDEVVDGVNCEILPVDDVGVHSVDLETNETTKTPVDRVSRHEAPEEFVRVTFSNGRSVLVTPEHPMFVDDGEITTVEARDIEEDTFVPAPRKLPNSSAAVGLTGESHVGKERDVDLPDELSEDLAEILGLLVAEGHTYAGSSHEIGFSNQDERLLDRMDRLMDGVFGFASTDTTNAHGTVTKRWVSTKLYRWFEKNVPEVMHTAREKRIPARVLGSSEEHIRRFLVGAFAGDGGVESEAMAFSTASPGLAEDYADALAKLGVASRIHYNSTEHSWKTYVMGDSTERFVDAVVEPADERHGKARAFVERSNGTKRHHDVLPTSAAREIRSLRRLVGLRLTGQFRPNLDEGFGVQVETVERKAAEIRDRVRDVRRELDSAADLEDVRAAVGWSGRQLAERLGGETTSAIHYAESGGYDDERRGRLAARAREAVIEALAEVEDRLATLESRLDLRYYRVTDVETVPNEGEYATDWVYDVTVEPTNTFVSQGVILHNSISISKAGINATLKSRCALLGAANPELGRFDRYETPAEQIDLEPALISRFDLIFTVTDQPDQEKDDNLAEHILRTNYAGELHTQRERVSTSTISDEEVDEATRSVSPAIEPDILRKYVAFARSTCFPTMTDESEQRIREFYVNLRSEGTGEDSPVPVTARKLEAIVRLAEASARIRLSDTVEIEDADRALEIVETTLKEIGMDPETGKYDADVIETGRSKSQRDRVRTIRELIADIEDEFEEGAPIDEVLASAEELDMDRSKAEHEIEKLKKQGEVYEPTTDHLRTT